jgi:hypothetical protein
MAGEGDRAVVCVNGGGGRELPGTRSASLEWLARRLVQAYPRLLAVEVRYRIREADRSA